MKFPIFFENSRVPVWLSKLAPIEIFAITIGPFVFCRDAIPDETKNHESIHWEQYKETLFIGFFLLYPVSYLINIAKGYNLADSYRNIWFEKEAYLNAKNLDYLSTRKRFAWFA